MSIPASPSVRSSCVVCSRVTSPTASETNGAIVCRICQSETGAFVRPCVCDGSMGGIHERCLAQWYAHSGKTHCEICLAEYARKSRVLKPIRQWSRPKITMRAFFKVLALICVSISIYDMVALIVERRTYERLMLHGLSVRSHDYGRFIVLFLLFISLSAVVAKITLDVIYYIRHQFDIRFTEHEKHRKAAAKKKMAFFG
ncbi:hypothetical protein M3Y96_00239700 [Aphelenchoides besseyi]|nr:hypothetical protein M3Y96_00239700 [Aphelenchoides besseyi]